MSSYSCFTAMILFDRLKLDKASIILEVIYKQISNKILLLHNANSFTHPLSLRLILNKLHKLQF